MQACGRLGRREKAVTKPRFQTHADRYFNAMTSLRDSLQAILQGYTAAVKQPFAQNPLASFIRKDAASAAKAVIGDQVGDLIVEGSAGAGNWASVPWIAVFDPAVTDTATRGYYLVYLFHHSEPVVHLSLNQGTTIVRKEFGSSSRIQMRSRAELIRSRVADLTKRFTSTAINLGSEKQLPLDYEAAHALGVSYWLDDLPSDEQLASDLREMVSVYRALSFRGGIDPSDEFVRKDAASDEAIIESRRYRFHRRIERNPSAAALVKKHLGVSCQACDLNFADTYGDIGDGFIEVHHLKPLSTLEEGSVISYSISSDFAVLCANCHRMIHRWTSPSDLAGFSASVKDRQRR